MSGSSRAHPGPAVHPPVALDKPREPWGLGLSTRSPEGGLELQPASTCTRNVGRGVCWARGRLGSMQELGVCARKGSQGWGGAVRGLWCPRPRHRRLLGAGGPAPWGAADGGWSGCRWRATSPAVLGQAPGPCHPQLCSAPEQTTAKQSSGKPGPWRAGYPGVLGALPAVGTRPERSEGWAPAGRPRRAHLPGERARGLRGSGRWKRATVTGACLSEEEAGKPSICGRAQPGEVLGGGACSRGAP